MFRVCLKCFEVGAFFIGVEDKSNKLIGFTRQEADSERNFFNNQVNEHIFPRPTFRISFLRYEIWESERFVIRVDVSESPVKPVVLKFQNVPSIYMRRDGFTNGAANVMEAAGTGFDKIIADYSAADEAHKPFICSASDHFTLVLPDLTYSDGIRDDSIPQIEFIVQKNGTEHDEKILAFCYNSARKVSEIASYLGIRDSSYFRKTMLENLVAQGYLTTGKAGNAQTYRTNSSMVKKV